MSKTSFAQSLITCANRTLLALAIFVPLLSVLGTIVAALEGWSLTRDGWYFGMVVAGTVGFGDLSPETVLGRAVTVYLILPVGLLGVGVIVGRVASTIIETRDAWKHEEQEEVKDKLRQTSEDAAETRLEMAGMRLALAELAASTRAHVPALAAEEPMTEEEEFRRKAARVAALLTPAEDTEEPPSSADAAMLRAMKGARFIGDVTLPSGRRVTGLQAQAIRERVHADTVDDNPERGPLGGSVNGNRQRSDAFLRPVTPPPARRTDDEPAYGTAAYYETAYAPDEEPAPSARVTAEWSSPSEAWSAPSDGGATAWSLSPSSDTSSDTSSNSGSGSGGGTD